MIRVYRVRSLSQGQGQSHPSTAPVPSDWTAMQFPHPQIHKWNLPNRRVSLVTLNSFNWGQVLEVDQRRFLPRCLVLSVYDLPQRHDLEILLRCMPTLSHQIPEEKTQGRCLCGFYFVPGTAEGYMHEAGILQGVTCRNCILLYRVEIF